MKIKESIIIDRSSEIVWEHIHDPSRMLKWNPRIKQFKHNPSVLPGVGYKFNTVYEMFGKADNFKAEIVEYVKPTHILIKYINTNGRFKGDIFEKIELKETRNGTRLIRHVDFKNSGLHKFLQLIIYLLGLLGRPIGKKYLAGLKEAVEC